MPAGIAFNPQGKVFIADGYANARVHKFSPNGAHLLSWGEPGTGPGQFNLPHGVWVDSHKDLYVVMPGHWGRTRRMVKFIRQG